MENSFLSNNIKMFRNLSLKNKIFFSYLAMVVLLSLFIGLFTRWVLINSLTSELKLRGEGIASGIAESGSEYILTQNRTELTSLIYDKRVGEKQNLIHYIFVTDNSNNVIAHTFAYPFPWELREHLKKDGGRSDLIKIGESEIFNIMVSVKEGIYETGRIHVGLKKSHIDNLISKLRITFVGFLSLVTIIFFFLSHVLSKYITKPIGELISFSRSVSQGDYNIDYPKTDDLGAKDEVWMLRNSFINMTRNLIQSGQKLMISEEKYRSLFEEGPNPIFVCDRVNLKIIDANPSAINKLGFGIDELKEMKVTDFGNFDPVILFRTKDAKGIKVPLKIKEEFTKKDGGKIFVSIHSSPARYENKDVLIIATPDITEIVEKESQLIQASKMTGLGIMSASIAHELNQPLNAIKMGSEFLIFMDEKGEKIAENELSEIVTGISSQVDRATEIINRLKEFGRKADFRRESVNINEQIRTVVKIVEKQFRLQNIYIELNLDESIPHIQAHGNRIGQVVFNLLTNARDAVNQKRDSFNSSFKGIINIKSYFEKGFTKFTVTDNGIGIPDEEKERIFDVFYTTKKMGEGMGMGLSIINGIALDYNGSIEVGKNKQGETEFLVKFFVG